MLSPWNAPLSRPTPYHSLLYFCHTSLPVMWQVCHPDLLLKQHGPRGPSYVLTHMLIVVYSSELLWQLFWHYDFQINPPAFPFSGPLVPLVSYLLSTSWTLLWIKIHSSFPKLCHMLVYICCLLTQTCLFHCSVLWTLTHFSKFSLNFISSIKPSWAIWFW